MATLPEHTVSNANDSAGIRFTDLFNLDEIQRLQDLFSDATGVASIITHPDGTPITRPSNFCRLCSDIIRKTEKGLLNCYQSDAILGRLSSSGAVVQPCLSSGLWDAGAGITVDGVHIANWLIGQIRNEELDEARMIQYAEEIGADRKDFVEALNEVPVMSAKQFRRVSDMLYTFANELSEKAYNNLLLKNQITQKITAEEQFVALHDDLRRSELFLKETQKIAQLGTYVLEIKTGNWASSEILDKIFGIDPDYDKSVEGWLSIIHPEWQQLMNDYFIKEVLGNKSNFDKEYKIVQNKSKEVRWVHGLGELVYDETGQPVKMIGTIRDITRYTQTQETITMLAHAIRSISECVSITDMDDQIIFVNSAFLKTYQYKEHELLGKSISLVRSPNNSPDLVKEILPATLNGNWHGELMNQRKDGTEFPVFVSSSVVRDENNIPIALIGVSENITARKETENQIIKLNEELDHRVKLRTAELEAANHELETFSYSVSHDLKAPLRHINGFIDLFMEKKSSNFTDEELGYLKTISDAAKGMGQLIDALLSFSRLNSAELHKTNIDSSVIVKEVIKFFEPEFQNRKITFRVEQLPDSKGDERLMRQVWTNLISNAIKYTSKKPEAVIDIGSMATVGEITFFIKDNGAGFNKKYATKLFGVFQRMHKTSDFEGIGIGLANVNRIVRRHGGTCRAESEAGMGATFYFSLPD